MSRFREVAFKQMVGVFEKNRLAAIFFSVFRFSILPQYRVNN